MCSALGPKFECGKYHCLLLGPCVGLMGRWLLYPLGTPSLVWGSMGQAMGPKPCQTHVCSHVICAGEAYVTRLKMCLGPLAPHRKELSSTELIPSNQFTTTASTGCRRMSCVK